MARRVVKLAKLPLPRRKAPAKIGPRESLELGLSMATPALRRAALCLVLMLAALAPQGARGAGEEVAAYKRAVEASFAQWLEALWPDAEAAGVSRETFDANLKALKLNWSLPHLVLPNPAGPDGPPLPEALAAAAKPLHQPEFDIPANYFNKTTPNVP